MNLISHSTNETLNIAKTFAKHLEKGDIVVLSGDLGAGKTKFVEGFLSYFNLENEISSPTFNIVNEYISNSKNLNIYHFDVYRLEDSDEFYAIGGEEYFEKGVCLIEWGEIISDVLPQNYIRIIMDKDDFNEDIRYINFMFVSQNNKYDELINTLKEELN